MGLPTYKVADSFTIPTVRSPVVSPPPREYDNVKFTISLLNLGTNDITVFLMGRDGRDFEIAVPGSGPGISLDFLSQDMMENGIEAIAANASTSLYFALYSTEPKRRDNVMPSALSELAYDKEVDVEPQVLEIRPGSLVS